MTDGSTPDVPPDATSNDAGAAADRKPRPSTSAASRARRIGGGTSGVPPRPAPSVPAEAEPETETVQLGKRAKKDPVVAATRPKRPVRAPRTVPGWLVWTPAVAFFGVAAVFLALLLVNRLGSDDGATTTTKQRQTVLAAAKECVAATNTYKYTDIDKYEAAGVKCTTGRYSTQYSNAMNTLIKKNAPTQKFTQIAQVTSAGIEAVTQNGKQWSILIYGQLNITNTSLGKAGRVDPFGLVATMAQDDGKWVIARIRLLSSLS